MDLEIFVGEPPYRIVTKSALLAYYDEETASAATAAAPLAAAASALGARAPRLADFIAGFMREGKNAPAVTPRADDGEAAPFAANLLGTAIRIHGPWQNAKEALRRAKTLARQQGLLFYCVNSEEWLNAQRPAEEHRAGAVFTSERGRITHLARHDAERLTDPAWFSEEASFGFTLAPELSMQAKAMADHYLVECRLGSAENEFKAETTRLSKVRDTLLRFYAGDPGAFSQLEFRRAG